MAAKLTLEEFLALPETKPYSEYVEGNVVQKATGTAWHGMTEARVAFVISLYLQQHPIGDAGLEVDCIFGPPGHERVYVPDFVLVTHGRNPRGLTNERLRCAPDFAVEVLSPDERMPHLTDKVRFYLDHGVRLVWIIDPDRRTVTALTPPETARIFTEDDTLDGGDALPGLSVPVRDILPPATAS